MRNSDINDAMSTTSLNVKPSVKRFQKLLEEEKKEHTFPTIETLNLITMASQKKSEKDEIFEKLASPRSKLSDVSTHGHDLEHVKKTPKP